jgi:valyl-tRNA synthetase
VLVNVLDGIIRLIHPVMPFVSESLWEALNQVAPERGIGKLILPASHACIAPWPVDAVTQIDTGTEAKIARMQDIVRGIRETRNRYMIDKASLDVAVKCSGLIAADLNPLAAFIKSLGQLNGFDCGPTAVKPAQSGTIIHRDFELYVSLAGLIDVAAEIKRLEKQIADKQKQLTGITTKLGNDNFVRNAPAEVVEQQKIMVSELEQQIKTMKENQTELAAT